MSEADKLSWSVDVGVASAPKSKYTSPPITIRSLTSSASEPDVSVGGSISRRWDAGQTDRITEAHWEQAQGMPIDSLLAVDLPTLQARSVHEYHNNPLIEGIVETHATDIIGPEGPTLEVLSDSDRFSARLEARWNEWTERCDHVGEMHLDEILRLWIRSIWHTGAWLGQETTDDTGDTFPCSMRLHDIHATRLTTPWAMQGEADIRFGVRRTKAGRALKYYIQDFEYWGTAQYETGKFSELPPSVVYHDYLRTESGQSAGFPLLASALPVIADLRDYDRSVLDAARLAADRSEWFVNLDPTGEKYEPDDAGSMETKHKRMVTRAAPPGWDVRGHDATHPTAQYVEHRRERMSELGRAAAIPLMLIRLDSSDHNYSSARFDHQAYCWHIKSWQKWIRKKVLNRLVKRVTRELQLTGDIRVPTGPIRYLWNWTPAPQGDPVKERAAERMGLQNRTLSFAAACRAQNLQEEDVIESWAKTFQRFVSAGFTREEAMTMLQVMTGGPGSRQPNDSRPGNNPANRPQSEQRG